MRFLRHLLVNGLMLVVAVSLALAQTPNASYTVKRGDTLYSIARAHQMTVDELRSMNGLSNNNIQAGQTLRVRTAGTTTLEEPRLPRPNDPVAPRTNSDNTITIRSSEAPPAPSPYGPATRGRRSYTVQPGDTYYSIGVAMGVPAYAIFALNEGDASPLEPNETIWVPDATSRSSQSEGGAQTYRVRRGDTMFSIAREHNTTVDALRQANGLQGTQLRVDQVLRIPTPSTPMRARQPLPAVYEQGVVDIYPETFAGRILSSGRPYDPTRFTVSHPDLPIESIVLLTNPTTGMNTFAEVSDRGPADGRFIMDISSAVARELGLSVGSRDVIQVRLIE